MRIVILGAPGSGKRTQTALLSERLNLSAVTTGELLKSAIAQRNPLGLEAKALQDAGRAVTEDIILGLLRERFLNPTLHDGFILDGFPRNLLQALTLDELLLEIDQPLDLILLVDIETDALMERLVGRRTCRSCELLYNAYRNPPIVDGVCDACGGRLHQRSDDNEETVSNRIHVFDHLIAPLITHYTKRDKLVRVDGNGEIEAVFKAILDAIDKQMGPPVEPSAPAESKRVAMEGDKPAEEGRKPANRTLKQKKTAAKPKKAHKKKARPSVRKTAKSTPVKRVASGRKAPGGKAAAAKPKASASKKKSAQVKKTASKKKQLKAAHAKVAAKKAGVKKRVAKKAVAKKAVKVIKKTAKKKPVLRSKKKLAQKRRAATAQKKAVRKTAKKMLPKKGAAKKSVAKKVSLKKKSANKKKATKKKVSRKR